MKRSTATRYAKRLDKLVRDRNERMAEYAKRFPGIPLLDRWPLRSERDFFAELATELRRLAARPKGKKKQSKVGA